MKTINAESASSRHILYVEEHEDSRHMLALTLERDGYVVSTATSMADGLVMGKCERFDLYILENGFADGSGPDLCRQIRAFDAITPIMFFSGDAYPSDIAAGLAAGAQQYLTKPMGLYTINQTIAELLPKANNVQLDVQREYLPNQEVEAHNLSFC